jgi:HlyD family secretion protein
MTESGPSIDRSIRKHLIIGISVCGLLIVGLGGWAATAELSGAVIGSGILVVESNVKAVQHPQGGVVGDILVKDGDVVRAGDVVVRLDDTQIRAPISALSPAVSMKPRREWRD